MKKLILISTCLFLTLAAIGRIKTTSLHDSKLKDPIVIEVITKYTSVEDALLAAKNALLLQKFIATNGIAKPTFNATRSTASKADYYVADVTASEVDGKVKLTISFIKMGTGLLKLQKVADAVKKELEK